ncbi:hypothetical protein C7S18_08850 [Ahniella affigens]|uniref:YcxB-like C-terminal domain-containing protein n=1 Tax=Ahniella affigens TaxID=2021234 RepID=A0A2P1PR34_9GAMM|nr:YcxB family protein [Ahniella affigens]AVP97292.1 hypothetical protein C7S18_08850 [Ahniella affigens]
MTIPTNNPFSPPSANLESDGLTVDGEMSLHYRLTALDHLRFNLLHVYTRLFPQAVMLTGSAIFASSFSGGAPKLLVFVGAYAVNSLIQLLVLGLMVFSARNRRLLTDYQTALTGAGLVVSTPFVRSLYYWTGVERVRSGLGITAVYVNSNAAQIIPKRAFAGDAQQAKFLSIIAERRLDV